MNNNQQTIRLYCLALKKGEKLQEAYEILKNTRLYFAINTIAKKLGLANIQDNIQVQQEINEKSKEIQIARNQLNRTKLKDLYRELGDIYFKYGDLLQAQESYFKAHENNIQSYSLDYALQWLCTMIWNQQFNHIKILNVTINNDATIEQQQQYQKWILLNAIRNYMKIDFKSFFFELLRINPQYLDSVEFITSYKDLGRYLIIGCILSKTPKDIVELFQNPFVIQLIDQDQFVEDALNCYIDYDLSKLILLSKQALQDLQDDVHSLNNLTQLQERIIHILLKQYIVNFKTLSIVQISNLVNLDVDSVIKIISSLIVVDNLNYLIDPIEMTIIQKSNPEERKIEQYYEMSKNLFKAIDAKMLQSLTQNKQNH